MEARNLLPQGCLIRKTLLEVGISANKFLQGVPLFKRLPDADIPVLAQV